MNYSINEYKILDQLVYETASLKYTNLFKAFYGLTIKQLLNIIPKKDRFYHSKDKLIFYLLKFLKRKFLSYPHKIDSFEFLFLDINKLNVATLDNLEMYKYDCSYEWNDFVKNPLY